LFLNDAANSGFVRQQKQDLTDLHSVYGFTFIFLWT